MNKHLGLNKIVPWIALFVICFSALLIIRLVFQREFDHDEFQHVHIAWNIKEGKSLYTEITDHHGPLYSYLNSTIWKTLNLPDSFFTIFLFRLINVFFMLGIVFLVFIIARKVFDTNTAWVASALLMTSYTFLRKAMEVRPDTQLSFWFLLGLLYLLNYIYSEKKYNLIIVCFSWITGLLLGVKIIISIYLFSFILYKFKNKNSLILPISLITSGLITIPLFIFAVNTYVSYQSPLYQMVYFFRKNAGTYIPLIQQPIKTLHFPFFYNNFCPELGVWILALLGIYLTRKSLSRTFGILIFLNALYLGNINKYSQWYLLAIPCFAILVAAGFWQLSGLRDKKIKWLCLGLITLPLVLGGINTYDQLSRYPKNTVQIKFTNYVLKHTKKTDIIHTLWSNRGGYMFRPYKYAGGISRYANQYLIVHNIRSIIEVQPQYVITANDDQVLLNFLKKYYARTPYPYFWGPLSKSLNKAIKPEMLPAGT